MGALEGRVVLVAGVGAGLGTATALTLLADGATVVGVARRITNLTPLEAHAASRHWRFVPRPADLRSQPGVDDVIRSVVQEFGRIDAVVLTAGRWIQGATKLHELSETEWVEAFRDNLEPVYRVLRAAVPAMIEKGGGSILLVSAGPGVRSAGSASYAAAKAAILELTTKLAADYRRHGIRVNAVLPGNMGSDVGFDPPDRRERVRLRDSIGTSPWEVAQAIRFLVSPESGWVTGAMLSIDGGVSTGGDPEPG
jgi:3-oxoacyl-[acyl-carrier protein] reductase